MVFSAYMQMNNVSHIKIGGYDEVGVLNNITGNPNFTFVKTASYDSWSVKIDRVYAFGE